MKFIKVLVVIIAVLCGVAFLLPREVAIVRTTSIEADVNTVFDQVNTLKNWENWSAWYAMEPTATYSYSEQASGADAWYSWEGDAVGLGTLTILESNAPSSIKTHIDFGGEGEGNGAWVFTEEGGQTNVSWTYAGDLGNNPVARWIGLMLEGMLGPQLETGLANLKAHCEEMPAAAVMETDSLQTDSLIVE